MLVMASSELREQLPLLIFAEVVRSYEGVILQGCSFMLLSMRLRSGSNVLDKVVAG